MHLCASPDGAAQLPLPPLQRVAHVPRFVLPVSAARLHARDADALCRLHNLRAQAAGSAAAGLPAGALDALEEAAFPLASAAAHAATAYGDAARRDVLRSSTNLLVLPGSADAGEWGVVFLPPPERELAAVAAAIAERRALPPLPPLAPALSGSVLSVVGVLTRAADDGAGGGGAGAAGGVTAPAGGGPGTARRRGAAAPLAARALVHVPR